jgi:hypothetical protein
MPAVTGVGTGRFEFEAASGPEPSSPVPVLLHDVAASHTRVGQIEADALLGRSVIWNCRNT